MANLLLGMVATCSDVLLQHEIAIGRHLVPIMQHPTFDDGHLSNISNNFTYKFILLGKKQMHIFLERVKRGT